MEAMRQSARRTAEQRADTGQRPAPAGDGCESARDAAAASGRAASCGRDRSGRQRRSRAGFQRVQSLKQQPSTERGEPGQRLTGVWLDAMVKSSLAHSDVDAFAAYLDAWAKTNILDKVQGRKLPVLVIPGEHDPALGVETCEATWMQHYPQARMEVMTNAGHYPMDETPLALVAAFERFLAAQP